MEDLAATDDIIFCATGITSGSLLRGVVYSGEKATTHSLIMRAKTGTVRFIETIHDFNKKPLSNLIRKDDPGYAGK